MDKPRESQRREKSTGTTQRKPYRPNPRYKNARRPPLARNQATGASERQLSLVRRWLRFINERFSPWTYIPMILLFVTMNGSFGSRLSGQSWINGHLAFVIPLIMSFFFRMRLFDEIKDYKTDINVNPTRPLPRGLLRINQVKKMIFTLILIELPLAGFLGLPVFAAYVMGLCFSLLMYNEFFLSDFLRNKLTTYAVSHTFVSVLLGLITSLALVGTPSSVVLEPGIALFLSNWALFNLFEFARKSFAKSEERENVQTYSNLFGVRGAWLLSLSQVVLTHVCLYVATQTWNSTLVAISGTYLILSLYYALTGNVRSAVFFRHLTSVVLLLSEVSIIYWLR